MVAVCLGSVASAKRPIKVPTGADDDNASERCVENAFVSMLDDATEKPYPDQHAWQAAEEHETNGAIGDLFPPHLDGNNDELHDCGVDESCSNGKRKRHMQKKNQDRRSDGACTNSSDCNRERYEKAYGQFHEPILTCYSD